MVLVIYVSYVGINLRTCTNTLHRRICISETGWPQDKLKSKRHGYQGLELDERTKVRNFITGLVHTSMETWLHIQTKHERRTNFDSCVHVVRDRDLIFHPHNDLVIVKRWRISQKSPSKGKQSSIRHAE